MTHAIPNGVNQLIIKALLLSHVCIINVYKYSKYIGRYRTDLHVILYETHRRLYSFIWVTWETLKRTGTGFCHPEQTLKRTNYIININLTVSNVETESPKQSEKKKLFIISFELNTNILARGNILLNLVIKIGEHVAPPVTPNFKLLSCSFGESFSKTDIISTYTVGVPNIIVHLK